MKIVNDSESVKLEDGTGHLFPAHCERESSALASLRGEASNDLDIESASNALSSLANSVGEVLETAYWSLKRDLMKLLIARIEIHRNDIRLVYKVPPNPFVKSPADRGFLQHWLSRPITATPLKILESVP